MTSKILTLKTGKEITPEELITFSAEGYHVEMDDNVEKAVQKSREFLEKHVNDGATIYGVNTGMGGFVHKLVPLEKAPEQQKTLSKPLQPMSALSCRHILHVPQCLQGLFRFPVAVLPFP